jgi:ribonucleoside-diphosphate reductase alpha chain
MQAAVQRWVDSSVSKTVNAPNEQTVEETEKAFTLAYESGLKGIAYFRDGCGRMQVLTKSDPQEEIDKLKKEIFQLKMQQAGVGKLAVEPIMLMEPREDGNAGCPVCGGVVAYEEGCKKCYACGWSAC